MTILSALFGIIMYHLINAPSHGNNVVDGINTTEKLYLKLQVELVGHLRIYDTSIIVILACASNMFHKCCRTVFTYYNSERSMERT